jgi:cytochrome c1
MSKLLIALLLCVAPLAHAHEGTLTKVAVQTDLPAVERGADNLMNNCHSCHSLKYIKYRDLLKLGISKQKVDGWRGELGLDTPLLAQMSESDALQSFGTAPPDLSLMTKARDGGPDYVYSYLLGYYMNASGVPGNHIFPETKMPDPLGVSGTSNPAQLNAIKDQARDIVSFLNWTADPQQSARLKLGYYVIGYLLVLTFLLYLVKNQIWSRLD